MIIPSVVPAVERIVRSHVRQNVKHEANDLVIGTVTAEDDISLYAAYSYVDDDDRAYTDSMLIPVADIFVELYSMETEM